jgi:hypothetical protein
MASDASVVHVGTVFGADIMVWSDGDANVCPWDDATHGASPAACELAGRVGESVDDRPTAHELLTRVDGIGDERAAALLERFDGSAVAGRAVSGWAALVDVPGISEDRARRLFDDLREAEVYEQLRYRRYAEDDDGR